MRRTYRVAKGFAAAIIQYISQIVAQVLRYAGWETLGAYANMAGEWMPA